jgi:8-oxo-dGTP diphosphatase
MNVDAQGARDPHRQRYQTVPRVLIFLTSRNPQTAEEEVLLLKGDPAKRLWANLYNGLGGHVEAGEDVYGAALREVREESGLEPAHLSLRGVVNIDTGSDEDGPRPGIMMFVFVAEAPSRQVTPSIEGDLDWLPLHALADHPLVDDLYALIPLALGGRFFYGHYAPQEDGSLLCRWRELPAPPAIVGA